MKKALFLTDSETHKRSFISVECDSFEVVDERNVKVNGATLNFGQYVKLEQAPNLV